MVFSLFREARQAEARAAPNLAISSTGLSMPAPPQAVVDRDEAHRILGKFPLKHPENIAAPNPVPTPAAVGMFRVTPTVVPVSDDSKGFGYIERVAC